MASVRLRNAVSREELKLMQNDQPFRLQLLETDNYTCLNRHCTQQRKMRRGCLVFCHAELTPATTAAATAADNESVSAQKYTRRSCHALGDCLIGRGFQQSYLMRSQLIIEVPECMYTCILERMSIRQIFANVKNENVENKRFHLEVLNSPHPVTCFGCHAPLKNGYVVVRYMLKWEETKNCVIKSRKTGKLRGDGGLCQAFSESDSESESDADDSDSEFNSDSDSDADSAGNATKKNKNNDRKMTNSDTFKPRSFHANARCLKLCKFDADFVKHSTLKRSTNLERTNYKEDSEITQMIAQFAGNTIQYENRDDLSQTSQYKNDNFITTLNRETFEVIEADPEQFSNAFCKFCGAQLCPDEFIVKLHTSRDLHEYPRNTYHLSKECLLGQGFTLNSLNESMASININHVTKETLQKIRSIMCVEQLVKSNASDNQLVEEKETTEIYELIELSCNTQSQQYSDKIYGKCAGCVRDIDSTDKYIVTNKQNQSVCPAKFYHLDDRCLEFVSREYLVCRCVFPWQLLNVLARTLRFRTIRIAAKLRLIFANQ